MSEDPRIIKAKKEDGTIKTIEEIENEIENVLENYGEFILEFKGKSGRKILQRIKRILR